MSKNSQKIIFYKITLKKYIKFIMLVELIQNTNLKLKKITN